MVSIFQNFSEHCQMNKSVFFIHSPFLNQKQYMSSVLCCLVYRYVVFALYLCRIIECTELCRTKQKDKENEISRLTKEAREKQEKLWELERKVGVSITRFILFAEFSESSRTELHRWGALGFMYPLPHLS